MNAEDITSQLVTIGVTGHRHFETGDTVLRVERLLDEVIGGLRPLVVSSLAEGADRLVAELVLSRPVARLAAILPVPIVDYERDFVSAESVAQFRSLVARAESVEVVDVPLGATREEAYERAGLEVVERCDVLIAVWDGAPARGRGGTASIVEHALAMGRRVEVVHVARDAVR